MKSQRSSWVFNRVYCIYLLFYFKLTCQIIIGRQKNSTFCQDRIEVIPFQITSNIFLMSPRQLHHVVVGNIPCTGGGGILRQPTYTPYRVGL